MNRLGAGDAYLLATVTIWGLTFPVAKHVLQFMPAMTFAAARFLLAAAVLFLVLAWRGQGLLLHRRDLLRLFGLGLVGIAVFQTTWANGLTLTTASKASILVNASPICAALMASVRGNPPSVQAWTGIVLSFAGIFLVINNSLTGLTIGGGTLLGDVLFLGAAALWALYSVLAPPLLTRLGPLKVTAWAMLLGSLVLLPFGLAAGVAAPMHAVPASAWAGFAFTVLLSAAFGFLWWYEGIRRLGVTRAMVYSYLIPLVAIGTAVLFLGESFSLLQGLGAAIVLAGIRLTRGA